MTKLIESRPLVTVYISTYNRVDLLRRAVESVRKQTYENLEIIIVDDCSTDDTLNYLEKIGAQDSRIRYFLKKNNSGACNSRNIAIKNATGEFITGLDDDDYFESRRIESFLEAVSKAGDKAYYSSAKIKISENIILSPSLLTRFKHSSVKSYKELLKQNFIGNQIFIKTDLLRKSGGFDEDFKAWQDLECWYNLMKTQNVKMKFISKATQVIDQSHEHERISKKNVENVIEAFKQFSMKHNLNKVQRTILEGQLIQYNPKYFSTTHKLLLLVLTKQVFYLKSIFNRGDQ